jgi:hypothetical protein
MPIHAVITGDIVHSMQLEIPASKRLISGLKRILESYQVEFYRGDSFQAYLKESAQALRTALLCRVSAISLARQFPGASSDLRISIGLGPAEIPVRGLATAQGEAFVLSGRALDDMPKKGGRLSFATCSKAHPAIFNGLELVSNYINFIFQEMTPKQAEVIYFLLNGGNQLDASRKLNKSKSTISQRASSANWPQIEKILAIYENLIKEITC